MKHILVIDDAATTRHHSRSILEDAGYTDGYLVKPVHPACLLDQVRRLAEGAER